MGQRRPKLWILGGLSQGGVPASELQRRLGDILDVVIVPPELAADQAIDPGADLVLSHAGELSPSPSPIGPAADALAALESLSLGVALAKPSGELAWSNDRYKALPETVRARVAAAVREAATVLSDPAVLRAGRPFRVDVPFPDDSVNLEVTVTPASGGPRHGLAILTRDVTADRRLRAKIDAIDAAGASLVGFNAETVRRVSAVDRLRLLETRIVQACRDLLRFDHFLIRVVDERTGKLEMIMHSGLPQEAVELEIRPAAEGQGISGLVAATGKSYVCFDTEADARYLPGFAGARSSLTVPLRLHDKIIGIFNVESDKVGAFTEDDRQFAEIFSRYVAISLHMLNLLVVERSATSESFSGRVEGEISAPLEDILRETSWLQSLAERDPEAAAHVQRIIDDVDSIRKRLRNVGAGAQTLLGVEEAMAGAKIDPVISGKCVLVADDEANIRRIVHDVLQRRGAEVCTFPNGLEAIHALEDAAAGRRPRFDAVLSDIRMPDRNGYEVFAAARRSLPGVPVILMTGFGYDPHHSIVRASQEGLQNVLFKPFPVDRLLEEIRKAVSPRPA